MKKELFSFMALLTFTGAFFTGCGTSDLVKVEKTDGSGSDVSSVKNALKITEDQSGVIHVKWDLRGKYGYQLILFDDAESKSRNLTPLVSDRILKMDCTPAKADSNSVTYECIRNDKSTTNFTVWSGHKYSFRFEYTGTNQYGSTTWLKSDPVATLTINGLNK